MFIMKDLLTGMYEAEKLISKATAVSGMPKAAACIKRGDKILIDYRKHGLVPDSLKIAEEKLWKKTKRIQDKIPGVYLGTAMNDGEGATVIEVSGLRKLDASPEYTIPTTISLYFSATTGKTGSKAPAYLLEK